MELTLKHLIITAIVFGSGSYYLGHTNGSNANEISNLKKIEKLKLESNETVNRYKLESMKQQISFRMADQGVANMDSIFNEIDITEGKKFNVSKTDTNRLNFLMDSLYNESIRATREE